MLLSVREYPLKLQEGTARIHCFQNAEHHQLKCSLQELPPRHHQYDTGQRLLGL